MLIDGLRVRGQLLGHPVEVGAFERHYVAPCARVPEVHPRGDLEDPVRGRVEGLLLEGHVDGLGAIGQAQP
eukprot:3574422-Lingulodinium_polyedra.AAC.1